MILGTMEQAVVSVFRLVATLRTLQSCMWIEKLDGKTTGTAMTRLCLPYVATWVRRFGESFVVQRLSGEKRGWRQAVAMSRSLDKIHHEHRRQ